MIELGKEQLPGKHWEVWMGILREAGLKHFGKEKKKQEVECVLKKMRGALLAELGELREKLAGS